METLTAIPYSTDQRLLHLDDDQTLFNWLMSGVKEIIKNKYVYISNECEEFKHRFNTVSLFVNETALVKTEKDSKSIVSSYESVFKQYQSFCEFQDEEALSKTKFNRELYTAPEKSNNIF